MAMATTAMYIAKRSQERNVRSFAQWSRASEAVFSKSSAPSMGVWRKMFLVWRL